MRTLPPRRDLLVAALAAVATRAVPAAARPRPRDAASDPLPDHADLWARMPLPFTPTQAWGLLPSGVRTELGSAVIGMVLAMYVAGDMFADDDQFADDDLRDAAHEVSTELLNGIERRVWGLFPELYGPEGDHPAWALQSGLAR